MDNNFSINSNQNYDIIQNLRSQIYTLNNQQINYQILLNEKENQIKNCINEFEYMKSIFEKEKSNYIKNDEENQKEIQILKNKIIQINQENSKAIDELRRENFKLTKEIDKKEELIEIKNNEITKFKNQYDNIEQLNENNKKQMLKMKSEYFFLKQILNDKENEIRELYKLKRKFNIKDLTQEESNQYFDYKNYDNLKLEFSQLNTKYKKLKEEKDIIFNNNEFLKNKLKNYDELNDKYLELNEKNNLYEKNLYEIKQLRNEIEDLKKINNQYKETFKILSTQNKTLLYKSTLEEGSSIFLSTSLSEKEYKDYLYKNIDELTNKINDLIEKNKELNKKDKIYSDEKNKLNKEIENYKNTISQMQNYIKDLEEINKSQYKKNLYLKSASCTVFLDESLPSQNQKDSIEESPSFKKLLQQNNELNDKIIKKDKIIDDLKKK